MPKRRKINQEDERRHPDSPDGIVVAAEKNRSFAERFVGTVRLRLLEARAKHGGR